VASSRAVWMASVSYQQFQARRLLLILESGSFAVLALVNFFFIPVILAQKESRRLPPSGWGRFKFMPCAFAEARPLSFKPPFSDFPSFLVHAGDLAIEHRACGYVGQIYINAVGKHNSFTG